MSEEYSDEIHSKETVIDVPTGVETTMYMANFVRNGKFGKNGEVGHECCICGTIYPDSKLISQGGKYYCIPRGCYKDLSTEAKGKRK